MRTLLSPWGNGIISWRQMATMHFSRLVSSRESSNTSLFVKCHVFSIGGRVQDSGLINGKGRFNGGPLGRHAFQQIFRTTYLTVEFPNFFQFHFLWSTLNKASVIGSVSLLCLAGHFSLSLLTTITSHLWRPMALNMIQSKFRT